MTLSIIACGGRDYNDRATVQRDLAALLAKNPGMNVIEGGAKGPDRFAGDWAANHRSIGVGWVRFPADWKAHGKAAGPIRNQQMLDWLLACRPLGHDVRVYAWKVDFDHSLSKGGTEDMVRRAELAGVQCVVNGVPRRTVENLAMPGLDWHHQGKDKRMAETETPETEGEVPQAVDVPTRKQGTVGYAASFYPARGQKRDVSIFLPFDVPEDQAQVASAIRAAFFEAKSAVMEQSGIMQAEVDYIGEDLILNENVEATVQAIADSFPGAEEVKSEPQSQGGGGGGGSVTIKKAMEGQPHPAWLDEEAAKAGITQVWDNRRFLPKFGGSGNPKSPWFKCVDTGKGIWPPKGQE